MILAICFGFANSLRTHSQKWNGGFNSPEVQTNLLENSSAASPEEELALPLLKEELALPILKEELALLPLEETVALLPIPVEEPAVSLAFISLLLLGSLLTLLHVLLFVEGEDPWRSALPTSSFASSPLSEVTLFRPPRAIWERMQKRYPR